MDNITMALEKSDIFDRNAHSATIIENDEEWKLILNSCSYAVSLMTATFENIASIISEKEDINCTKISRSFTFSAKEALKIKSAELGLTKNIDLCYPIKIEGAENYQSNLRTYDVNRNLQFDVITVSLGVNYKNFCSNYARTLLINPTKTARINYDFMKAIQRKVFNNLVDGVELCRTYEIVKLYAEKLSKNLAMKLGKNFGFALCTNVKDERMIIDAKTKAIARKNMIFAITVELSGLEEGKQIYKLCITDTVIVRDSDIAALPLTIYKHNLQTFIFEEENDKLQCD